MQDRELAGTEVTGRQELISIKNVKEEEMRRKREEINNSVEYHVPFLLPAGWAGGHRKMGTPLHLEGRKKRRTGQVNMGVVDHIPLPVPDPYPP